MGRPGFRERLVMSDCDILTDRFFRYFSSCFRLYWPYSVGDAYYIDPTTNLYSFSDTFDRHVRDIGMWTFNDDFFKVFPNLLDDMEREKPVKNTAAAPTVVEIEAACETGGSDHAVVDPV